MELESGFGIVLDLGLNMGLSWDVAGRWEGQNGVVIRDRRSRIEFVTECGIELGHDGVI